MREIKFRAWHAEFKRMFYQSELDDLVIELRRSHQDCHRVALVVSLNRGICMAIWYAGCLVQADKFELMQYTGLKDKNGKEIYEGDIIKILHQLIRGNYGIEKVVWEEHGCGFYPFSVNPNFTGEVIGNIYENPELLEV